MSFPASRRWVQLIFVLSFTIGFLILAFQPHIDQLTEEEIEVIFTELPDNFTELSLRVRKDLLMKRAQEYITGFLGDGFFNEYFSLEKVQYNARAQYVG